MQVNQDYQKALQQINNNGIPEDLLADGIKNIRQLYSRFKYSV